VAGARRGERAFFFRAAVEGSEHRGDLRVARGDELLVRLPQLVGLAQGEEVFLAPVAAQTFGDRLAAGFDAVVFQLRQRHRIAFATQDGFQYGQARHAGDVADDVLELNVHLRERLVQVVHAPRRSVHQPIAVA
jgi:hypothetical protein